MAERLRTGIDVLDRKLEGGLPAGSVVVLRAAPASQSELFLYELTNTRETLYLSFDRDERAVADGFARATAPTGEPTIQYVPDDAPFDRASKAIGTIPEESNAILDPMDVLEAKEPARYRTFLNDLCARVTETGGLAVLHCLDGDRASPLRDTTEHMADAVFHLQTEIEGDTVSNRLAVPKLRGGQALAETVKLQLTDSVAIDTSRDIA
ncbi:transcriptional regulator [Halobacteriales archaeon QS_3_64_16]|nr:MAG: transcriptional regulator [Halobacteriales archaeon QS_3_64_16]